jgi:hypothetical protein
MLTEAEIAQFFREGYIIAPNVFTEEELNSIRKEITSLISATAQRLWEAGTITEMHTEEGFETRLTRLLEDHPELTGEYLRAIEGKGGGGHTGVAMFAMLTHKGLLDRMEQLVGEEIVASSVYRIRPKVPGMARGAVPWHQDSGYFASHCDKDLIVTCWVPLVDATLENGCLYLLPRTHEQGVFPHKSRGPSGYLIIPDQDLPEPPGQAIPIPMKAGGVLLLTNHTPHCSTLNSTDTIRWSLDLRYQARNAPTNAFQSPQEFDLNAPPSEIACYPPEGDFVVRSKKDPSSVHTHAQYIERRAMYEQVSLPVPGRSWEPYATSP